MPALIAALMPAAIHWTARPAASAPVSPITSQCREVAHSHRLPSICRELGGVPASTLYHYLHADGTLKAPGLKLLGGMDTAANGNPPAMTA